MAFWNKNEDEIDGGRDSKKQQLDKEFDREEAREKQLSKFKMGQHHIIERQLVTLVSAGVLMVLGLGVSFHGNAVKNSKTLSAKAIYTKESVFSKNGALKAKVVSVSRSKDNKTGYLLFKFDKVDDVSQDANNYKVYVSAFRERLKTIPVGNLFIFGTSGYMGVRIHDEAGLPNQVLDITIRSEKDVARQSKENEKITEKNGYGESFKKFNQIRFYENFGAKEASRIDLTDGSSPEDMFYALVGKEQDDLLREKYLEQSKAIGRLIDQMEEYQKQIVDRGFNAPETPDVFRDLKATADGIETTAVVPGGYNLRPASDLKSGYLSQMISGDITEDAISNLLAAKKAEENGPEKKRVRDADGNYSDVIVEVDTSKLKGAKTIDGDPYQSFRIEKLVKTDGGKELEVGTVQSDLNSTTEMAVAESAANLTKTYTELWNALVKLQRDVNEERVRLDETMFAQKELYSQTSGEGSFNVWQQVK